MQPCTSCGVTLAPSQILYSADADVVCTGCHDKADLVDTDKRAAANIVKAAWASFGAGVVSMIAPLAMMGVITYFFIAAAALSAVFALQSIARGGDNDRFTKYLSSGHRMTVWVCSGLGLALAAASGMGYAQRLALYVIAKT